MARDGNEATGKEELTIGFPIQRAPQTLPQKRRWSPFSKGCVHITMYTVHNLPASVEFDLAMEREHRCRMIISGEL